MPWSSIIPKRKIYHGTNTKFDELDFNRGGGFVNFAEKPEIAKTYADDLGSGSRNRKKWADIVVKDLDNGVDFTYNPETKLWVSSTGKEIFEHSQFKEMMDEGERYFEAYPKDSRILKAEVDLNKILNTYPDRSKPYYNQANKKGLEAFLDVVDSSKVENTINPQFTQHSQRYVDKIRKSAIDEMKNVPGNPGFGNTFWSTSKFAGSDEINQALKGVSDQLKSAGYEGLRFADDSHPTIAMMKSPSNLEILTKKTMKSIPYLGMAATVAGGLGYSDIAGAASDIVVPGGVEELGISSEQQDLDRRYKERIRQLQERKK